MPTHACEQAALLRCQAGIFPCRTFSSPGRRSRCCLFAQAQRRGCPATVPHLPLPGLAFQPSGPSEKREKQPPSRGGQSGCCRVGKAPTSLLPAPGSPGGLSVPLVCPPWKDPPPPCRGAVGPGLPHGAARTIWEGGHVTLAGRERHVKGSAEALFGSGVAAESPAHGPRPHPMPDPSSRGNRAMGRGPQGWFLGRMCPAGG